MFEIVNSGRKMRMIAGLIACAVGMTLWADIVDQEDIEKNPEIAMGGNFTIGQDCEPYPIQPEYTVTSENASYGYDASVGCFWDRRDECHYWYRWGEWMPEQAPLWQQFAADPRQVTYSVAWRFNDQVIGKNIVPVSFGDYFALYRWHGVWPWGGDMEFGVEGGVWAVFSPLEESSPLIDADYYVGFPLVYAFDKWQFRLRGYHISTHLGDEFLLNNPGFDRRNPSAEYLDFFVSYYFANQVRLYAGLGYILHQDISFRNKRFFSAFGMEVRMPSYGFLDCKNRLYGLPFLAVYIRQSRDFKHHVDQTYALGYEWGKTYGLNRRVRAFLEYHDGYSIDGQFSHRPTNYLAIRLTYGF